jgi:hypothetical protein
MTTFVFPYDTCETVPGFGMAQPYSVAVGIVTVFVLLWFAAVGNARVFLTTLALFEIFHVYSHFVHNPGFVQSHLVHGFAYVVNATLLWTLATKSQHNPRPWFVGLLALLALFDAFAYAHYSVASYIFTQMLLFLALLLYYYRWLPQKRCLPWLVGVMAFSILVQINEQMHCQTLLAWAPGVPWHVLTELGVLFSMGTIAYMFSNL